MKGSEKQVAWAEESRNTVISIFRGAAAEIEKQETNQDLKEKNIAAIEMRISAIQSADYAGDIINLFKGIHNTGDVARDFSKLLAIYRVNVPCTAGEQKILCK